MNISHCRESRHQNKIETKIFFIEIWNIFGKDVDVNLKHILMWAETSILFLHRTQRQTHRVYKKHYTVELSVELFAITRNTSLLSPKSLINTFHYSPDKVFLNCIINISLKKKTLIFQELILVPILIWYLIQAFGIYKNFHR